MSVTVLKLCQSLFFPNVTEEENVLWKLLYKPRILFYMSIKLIKKVFLAYSVCRYVFTDERLSYETNFHYNLHDMSAIADYSDALSSLLLKTVSSKAVT
jgi:hypothetical protein